MERFRNILIRNLTDEQYENVREVMKETGQATASKAILDVCRGYFRMVTLLNSFREENIRLKKENAMLHESVGVVIKAGEKLKSMEIKK